jgi:hypothetical protein
LHKEQQNKKESARSREKEGNSKKAADGPMTTSVFFIFCHKNHSELRLGIASRSTHLINSIQYDPVMDTTSILASWSAFANGIAVDKDGTFVREDEASDRKESTS